MCIFFRWECMCIQVLKNVHLNSKQYSVKCIQSSCFHIVNFSGTIILLLCTLVFLVHTEYTCTRTIHVYTQSTRVFDEDVAGCEWRRKQTWKFLRKPLYTGTEQPKMNPVPGLQNIYSCNFFKSRNPCLKVEIDFVVSCCERHVLDS